MNSRTTHFTQLSCRPTICSSSLMVCNQTNIGFTIVSTVYRLHVIGQVQRRCSWPQTEARAPPPLLHRIDPTRRPAGPWLQRGRHSLLPCRQVNIPEPQVLRQPHPARLPVREVQRVHLPGPARLLERRRQQRHTHALQLPRAARRRGGPLRQRRRRLAARACQGPLRRHGGVPPLQQILVPSPHPHPGPGRVGGGEDPLGPPLP
mmetsp:Transcript_27294/g.71978  ORF Transcript_27294/g.71978 Transcript_27294/m.71978 type:complete len:205 (-) Transcript_27294:49-663(-)